MDSQKIAWALAERDLWMKARDLGKAWVVSVRDRDGAIYVSSNSVFEAAFISVIEMYDRHNHG